PRKKRLSREYVPRDPHSSRSDARFRRSSRRIGGSSSRSSGACEYHPSKRPPALAHRRRDPRLIQGGIGAHGSRKNSVLASETPRRDDGSSGDPSPEKGLGSQVGNGKRRSDGHRDGPHAPPANPFERRRKRDQVHLE